MSRAHSDDDSSLPARVVRSPWPVRSTAVVLGLVLVVVAVVVVSIEMVDFAVYRSGGSALLDGSPLYTVHPDDSLLPFTYPPFAAMVFVPFAVLSVSAGQLVLTGLSIAALARAMWLVARETAHPRAWFPTLLLLAAAIEPTQATLAYGQVNLLIVWLVVEDLLGRGRTSRVNGAMIGLAAGFKLVPGLFAAQQAVVGRWRSAVIAFGTLALTVGVGFLVQPSSAWDFWTDLVWQPERVGGVDYAGNQSLSGAADRLVGSWAGGWWLVAAATVLAAWVFVARRLASRGDELLLMTSTAVAALLLSPISWSHHWVWIPVLVAGAWQLGDRGVRAGRGIAVAFALVASSWLLWWWPDEPSGIVAVGAAIGENAYVLIALAYLAALVWSVTGSRFTTTTRIDAKHTATRTDTQAV